MHDVGGGDGDLCLDAIGKHDGLSASVREILADGGGGESKFFSCISLAEAVRGNEGDGQLSSDGGKPMPQDKFAGRLSHIRASTLIYK